MFKIPSLNLTNETTGEVQIMTANLFFGLSFVCARYAMLDSSIGPITYTACRFFVSTVLIWLYKMFSRSTSDSHLIHDNIQKLWLMGALSGIANFGAGILMQLGMVTVSAGKAGFITGMYVVFVPIVEYLIPGFGTHLSWKSWVAAILCLLGMYLISGCAEQAVCLGGAFKGGEALLIGCMFCWVIAIMADDVGAKSLDVLSLVCINFFITTVLSLSLAVVVEPQFWVYPFSGITQNLGVIFTLGCTFCFAFALTTFGQSYVQPARASLLMSMESLVAMFCAYLFLDETLTWIELSGCLAIFVGGLVSCSFDFLLYDINTIDGERILLSVDENCQVDEDVEIGSSSTTTGAGGVVRIRTRSRSNTMNSARGDCKEDSRLIVHYHDFGSCVELVERKHTSSFGGSSAAGDVLLQQ